MKAMEGIDLNEAMRLANEEIKASRLRMVSSAIVDELRKRDQAAIKASRLKNDYEKAQREVDHRDEVIAKLQRGDWTVLPEPKEEKDNKQVSVAE